MSLLESIFKGLAETSRGKNKFHFFEGKDGRKYVKSGPKSKGRLGTTLLHWISKK